MDFWIVGAIAAFVLGLSKGGMPVIAILSVPLMSIFMHPALAAGLLMPIYIIADQYAIYLFRKQMSKRNLLILLPSAVVGILVGYLAISHVSVNAIKLMLAFIGFSYLGNAIFQRITTGQVQRKPADLLRGIFWGSLAGFTSYMAHAGGPPYQAYTLPQKLDKMVYLGTTTVFFACVNLMKVPAFILAGQMTWDSFINALWLAPFALIGAFSGSLISRWLSQRAFFLLIETALGLISLKLLLDVIL